MEYVQWIFSGIGTQMLTSVISMLIGGIVGYHIRDKQIGRQKQIAGNSSNQHQEMHIGNKSKEAIAGKESQQELNQVQKAGDKSTQVQIGDIDEHNGG